MPVSSCYHLFMLTATHICQVCDCLYEEKKSAGNFVQVKKICPKCREWHRWCAKCSLAKLLSDFPNHCAGKQHSCRSCLSLKTGQTAIWKCAHCEDEYLTTRSRRYNGQNDWYCHHCIDSYKRCKKCDTVKTVNSFYRRNDSTGGRVAHCIPCLKIKTDAAAEGLKLKKYGLTVDGYRAMFEEQNGSCFLCKKPESNIDSRTGKPIALAVDHCHESNVVRRLLCQRCNQALGLLRDDAALMREAADYIEHFASVSL